MKVRHWGSVVSFWVLTMGAFGVCADDEITQQAKVVSWSSQYNDSVWAAKNLLDGKVGSGFEWASGNGPQYPLNIVIDLAQRTSLSRVEINPYTTEHNTRWSKGIELYVSDQATGPWQNVASYRLAQENRYQSVATKAVMGRYLQLSITSNWGGSYAELGDVRIFKAATGSGPSDTPSNPPNNPDGRYVEITSAAKVVKWTSQFNNSSWKAANLLDGKTGAQHEWASLKDPKYPQYLVIDLGGTQNLGKIAVFNKTSEGKDRWSKEISVDIAQSISGPWTEVIRTQLAQNDQFQPVVFSAQSARFVRLAVLSNWGGNYAEMAELKLFALSASGDSGSTDGGSGGSDGSNEIELANTRNIASVVNGPTAFAKFTLKKKTVITKINTYHWNNGNGTPSPGQIGIRLQGSWQAKGLPGMYDTPNAEWWVYPNITLAPGTYTITDSDAATWSHNDGSNGVGHFAVYGYEVD